MMDRPSDNDPEDLDDLELFYEFASTRQRSIRNRLVERHMGLAAHIAKRFSRPGLRCASVVPMGPVVHRHV